MRLQAHCGSSCGENAAFAVDTRHGQLAVAQGCNICVLQHPLLAAIDHVSTQCEADADALAPLRWQQLAFSLDGLRLLAIDDEEQPCVHVWGRETAQTTFKLLCSNPIELASTALPLSWFPVGSCTACCAGAPLG